MKQEETAIPDTSQNQPESVTISEPKNYMPKSRISRIEEKRTKKQLFLVIAGMVVILVLVTTIGIPLIVNTSVFLGNLKSKQNISDSGDSTAPFPPTLSPVNEATNSAIIKIEGYAEPQATLKIFVNGDEIKNVLLGIDGGFSFSDISLEKGENLIYAKAIDTAGNESSDSQTLTVTFKNEGPKLEVNEPQDNQNVEKIQQISVKGKTDIGISITINDRFVSVKDDGTFEYSFKLIDGENIITILAKDNAGNETKIERKVNYSP